MGSIVLQVNGSTVGNVSEGRGIEIVRSVTEQDSGRLVMALGDYYASRFQSRPGPGGSGEPILEKTVENIIRVWWEDVIRDALKKVERYEARNLTPPPVAIIEG